MKKCFWITMCLLALSLSAFGAKKDRHPLMGSDKVVWAGLDYSMVRMVGPGDFRDPSAIFPAMLDNWNSLFLVERIKKVEEGLKKKVAIDIAGVTERNKAVTDKQIIPNMGPNDGIDQTHITSADIAAAVKSLTLESKEGLGLVFIVDRLVKMNNRSALYVVFFDVATREVISAERQVQPASGFGFRNFWFGSIKRADATLKKYR